MRYWDKSFHGSWHLFGHVHGGLAEEDAAEPWRLTMDVGVDACNYQPVDFDLIESYMQPRIKEFKQRRESGLVH